MAELATGWGLDVDVSPNWLFLVLRQVGPEVDPSPPLAEYVWQIAEQHSVSQFVFELGGGVVLTSHLVGQLVLLLKRSCQNGGTLRICGFAPDNYTVLQVLQVSNRLPNYRTREEAIAGRP